MTKRISLRSGLSNGFIELPVDFVDAYMPEASGEALKVYLYLLRASRDSSILLSVNDMADLFDVTPKKILLALSYWEERSLLTLDFSEGELTGIAVLPLPDRDTLSVASRRPAAVLSARTEESTGTSVTGETSPEENFPSDVKTLPDRTDESPMDLSSLNDDSQFEELLSLSEIYFKRPLSATQRESLGVCYLMFDRQCDIVEYLLEYCLDQGKSSFHYIEAVARGWKEEGYTDLSQIRESLAARSRNTRSIMNAFGLTGRSPAKSESDYILSWTRDFDLSLILEACNRTMTSIHKPSFRYTDTILLSWKDAGVRTRQDIDALDEKRAQAASAARAEKPAVSQKKPANSFRNFDERDTDYNALIANFYES